MFGILDCILSTLDFSKLFRTKLLARIGLADRTGITQSTKNVRRDYTRWMAGLVAGQFSLEKSVCVLVLRLDL